MSKPFSPWHAVLASRLGPPEHFWTSGDGGPAYRYQEPIRALDVSLVRLVNPSFSQDRRTVLRLEIGPDGRPEVVSGR